MLTQKQARFDFVDAHGPTVEVLARQGSRVLQLAPVLEEEAEAENRACGWYCAMIRPEIPRQQIPPVVVVKDLGVPV